MKKAALQEYYQDQSISQEIKEVMNILDKIEDHTANLQNKLMKELSSKKEKENI